MMWVRHDMYGEQKFTNTFRQTDLKITFCTLNTIHNTLTHKYQTADKYIRSGVYKLTCPNCKKAYVEQAGRSFAIQFNKHINAYKNNSHTSKYAKHLTELAHFP
jgi:hypothetical protein